MSTVIGIGDHETVVRIRLETMSDIKHFMSLIKDVKEEVKLVDGNNYCVNAKSILGATAALEWNELYVVSVKDLTATLKDFYI